MCMCEHDGFGKSRSIYSLSAKERTSLTKKLPQLTQHRIEHITKHILFNFLDKHADYIFGNGKIYTMNEKEEEVEAVAIKNGQIIFVGKMVDSLVYKGAETKIVDLKGKTMLPGFVDPHIHMCFTMFRDWIDMSPFVNENTDEIQQKMLKKIQQVKGQPNEWVTGQLFDPTVTEGHLDVSIQNLDKLCPNNPLFILQANAHVAHVNSMALKMAGITHESADPPHGRYIRDADGKMTGELQQLAVLSMNEFIMSSAESYIENFKHFLQHCSSKGCTTLHDCGIGLIDPEADLAVLYSAMEDNPPVRYSGFLVSTAWKTWMERKMVPQFKDPYLRINGVKCWADGSIQGGSAFLREDYLKEKWGRGKINYEMDILVKSIKVAHDNGWQVGIHANGDAGIDFVLDAYEKVQKQNPKPQLRHRIEHCTLCHKDQLKRMKDLHVYPSFLIGHVYYYGHAFKDRILGAERASIIDPMKSASQLKLRPSMHSDYNCQPVDPIRCIYNSVTRKMKYDGVVLGESECLTPYQAIKAITIDSAWQCHMEDIVGSIEVGKKADFVILDKDPMMIPESEIINIKIVETWMDGSCRFRNKEIKPMQSINSSMGSLNSFGSMKSQDSNQ